MMNKKAAAAAGIGLLYAITMVVCSCYAGRYPAAIYDDATVSDANDDNSDESELNSQESVTANTSTGSTENTYDNAPGDPPKTKIPKFDDPDSYLNYDVSTDTYILTQNEDQIGKESLFVGDSICYGFSAWGVLSGENVYATGNVGARNMLEYDMYYQNKSAKFIPVLNEVKPKHVFLWMGMNDVNMTSSEEYCENYDEIICTALENSTADVYVCAITPISNLDFTEPSYIAEFNDAIERHIKKNFKERVHFINFGEPLKNKDGILDGQNNGGDGIHLSKRAYYIAMHEIVKQMDQTEFMSADIPMQDSYQSVYNFKE